MQQLRAFGCTLLHSRAPDIHDSKGISVDPDHFGSRKSLVRIQLPRPHQMSVPEPTIHERLDPRIGAFLRSVQQFVQQRRSFSADGRQPVAAREVTRLESRWSALHREMAERYGIAVRSARTPKA